MQRDAIDFGRTNVPRLFVKLFVPTLLGFLFTAIVTLADGVFVGRGVGSDALAAINIAAPVFMIATGIALMFGSGVSIVAAIHLGRGSVKAARINMTQAIGTSLLLMLLVAAAVYLFPRQVGFLFGGSERLMPYIIDYLYWVMPALVCMTICVTGIFIIRLDGSPNYAMWANAIGSVLNIVLDWVFVFPLDMGIKGAAIATSLSQLIPALMVLYYLLYRSKTMRFYRLKMSHKSVMLTLRNVGYQVKMGLSTFIGETAMTCMMIVGNFMFMQRLGEDGVAAWSIACYMFPLIFMFGNALAQSALPIISFNHGSGQTDRIRHTLRLEVIVGILSALLLTLGGWTLSPLLVSGFLDASAPAYAIAVEGFPWYSLSFLWFTLNLVFIGYYQAIERATAATLFMSLRGYFFIIPIFIFLPKLLDNMGLWLAVPLSELLTFLVIVGYMKFYEN